MFRFSGTVLFGRQACPAGQQDAGAPVFLLSIVHPTDRGIDVNPISGPFTGSLVSDFIPKSYPVDSSLLNYRCIYAGLS